MEAVKIRNKRKSLGLTQKDLAIKLGVSGNTIINWERGDKIPDSKIHILRKFLNEDEKVSEKNEIIVENNKKITGYYLPEVNAAAGLEDDMQNNELKRIPVSIPGWENEVIFINVYGDSMYPKYNAGEIIGVKTIEFAFLNYGYPYVIVLTNGDTYIKIVQPGTDKENLILESINEFYKPKEFHLSLIKSFYSIKGVIKKEMM